MDEELRRNVIRYRITMSIIREMVTAGILTEEDYAEIDTIIAGMWSLKSSTIFR